MSWCKPCPFCGGTDITVGRKEMDNNEGENLIIIGWVECAICGAKTKAVSCVRGDEKSIDNAFEKMVNAWNRRAEDKDAHNAHK